MHTQTQHTDTDMHNAYVYSLHLYQAQAYSFLLGVLVTNSAADGVVDDEVFLLNILSNLQLHQPNCYQYQYDL